jgi:predicted transcriptional regulator
MSGESMLEKLFFELASESRLSILRELKEENLKMLEISRRLNVTATEACRQLERLSNTFLVQRQPDGTFMLAQYGKIVLQLSLSLNFVSKYSGYFSTHDLMGLPSQFVNRISELSNADLEMDVMKNIDKGCEAFLEAEQYGWGMGESKAPEHMASAMNQRVQEGLKLRSLRPEMRIPSIATPKLPKNVEVRCIPEVPATVILTEKTAGVCLRQIGGRMDFAGFLGKDPTFHRWAEELFLH